MSHFYRLTIQYRGTRFSGWQIQAGGEKTIQGELEKALRELAKGQDIKSIASGRTDTGVHAFAQVARVEFPFQIDPNGLLKGLNSIIDNDIKILECVPCDENFHPIFSAHSKQYRYYFTLNASIPVFYRDRIVFFADDLDLDLMKEAAKCFVGEKDFLNYYTVGSEIKTSVRNVTRCEILPFKLNDLGDENKSFEGHYLLIEGNGFLKQMVRMIMGALVHRARNRIALSDIEGSFNTKLPRPLAAVAPAHGLHLNHVSY